MRYQVEMQPDGWRVLDRFRESTAEFGGMPLDHLTEEEARVMVGMLEDRDKDSEGRLKIPLGLDGSKA